MFFENSLDESCNLCNIGIILFEFNFLWFGIIILKVFVGNISNYG